TASINYPGTPFCSNGGTANVNLTGTSGGTFSSTAGLSINVSTGEINLGTSTAGTYIVTYTIPSANGCPTVTTTTSVSITALPAAPINYATAPFCKGVATAQPVTRTGTAGGIYSAPAGITINGEP